MAPSLALENRRVLVAGAGGLGGACVAGFAEAGRGSWSPTPTGSGCGTWTANWTSAAVLTADLSRPEDCRTVVDEAVATLGGLDVFVHALGVNDRAAAAGAR